MRFSEKLVKESQRLDGKEEVILESNGQQLILKLCLFAVLTNGDRAR